MTPETAGEAARLIGEARRARQPIGELPARCRPATLTEGYEVQAALSAWRRSNGEGAPVGYKVGCTNAVMREALGVPHPASGRIHATGVHRTGATVARESLQMAGAECEIAVRIGQDVPSLDAPHDRDRIAEFVAACMPAMEIVDNRYGDFRAIPAAIMVADDFFHAACVLGAETAGWRRLDLSALPGRIRTDGAEQGQGLSAQVMGHPFAAVAWLANSLHERGETLRAGDIVLTGAIAPVLWIDRFPCSVEIEVGNLGSVSALFQ